MSPLTTTATAEKIAHWNREFGFPPDADYGSKIQSYFRLFEPCTAKQEWRLGRAEHYADQIASALTFIEPAKPKLISVRRIGHFIDQVEFEAEDTFKFGRFYGDGIRGADFSELLREFFNEQLLSNMEQRAFQTELSKKFGECARVAYGLHGNNDFRGARNKIREVVQNTPFASLFYLIAEGLEAVSSHLIDAIVSDDIEKTERLGKLFALYAHGLPVVEFFHGKLLILEA
jgi:hypothetical protein